LYVPVGRQAGSYSGLTDSMMSIGSPLSTRNESSEINRAIWFNRMESRQQTIRNYMRGFRSFAKRISQQNASLTPELKAIITDTGDGLSVHGDYIFLNPACDYLLAHDFADQQFSFRYVNGQVRSSFPNEIVLKDSECSSTSTRVRICREGNNYVFNVPLHYGRKLCEREQS
jgi:hypothetical protein